MSLETSVRIFEPFFSTKEFGKGTGLGLSTVYGVVQQAGGHIDMSTQLGKGTSMRVYFPVQAREPDLALGRENGAPVTPAKVLVIEDQQELRALIAEILKDNGFTVLAAGSGDEALEKFADESGRLDLIITDVVMPRISGPALAKKMGPNIPVLYISGYTNNELNRYGLEEKNGYFLSKPFDSKELIDKVSAAIRGERSGRPRM
jgi:two-component system cell cycle sensor histidine kinase/response regulator CckA